MDDEQLAQAFDLDRPALVLDFEGDGPALRQRWAGICRGQRHRFGAARTVIVVVGLCMLVIGVSVMVADALVAGLHSERLRSLLAVDIPPELVTYVAPAIAALGLVLGVIYPWLERRLHEVDLDARKRGLVDALVAYLERELGPGETLSLHVEFLPAFRGGHAVCRDARFDFSELALPDTEPNAHDWLLLSTKLGDDEINLRVRSLVGKMGYERRIRDEIGVEIDGPELGFDLGAVDETRLRTQLRDHEHGPARARFLFRGAGAGRCTQLEPEPALLHDPTEPPEYEYEDLEWLLRGSALVDHIECVRRVTQR